MIEFVCLGGIEFDSYITNPLYIVSSNGSEKHELLPMRKVFQHLLNSRKPLIQVSRHVIQVLCNVVRQNVRANSNFDLLFQKFYLPFRLYSYLTIRLKGLLIELRILYVMKLFFSLVNPRMMLSRVIKMPGENLLDLV